MPLLFNTAHGSSCTVTVAEHSSRGRSHRHEGGLACVRLGLEQPDQRSWVAGSPVVYGVLSGSGCRCDGGTGFVMRTGTSMRAEGAHGHDGGG
jgi:hypothetical protein